jgi:hypothetical protein
VRVVTGCAARGGRTGFRIEGLCRGMEYISLRLRFSGEFRLASLVDGLTGVETLTTAGFNCRNTVSIYVDYRINKVYTAVDRGRGFDVTGLVVYGAGGIRTKSMTQRFRLSEITFDVVLSFKVGVLDKTIEGSGSWTVLGEGNGDAGGDDVDKSMESADS